MIRRLSEIDLPRRLERRASRWVIELAVALVSVAAALSLRAMIEAVTPGVVPSALLFPAVMVATLMAGGRAGAIAVPLGGLATWYFILPEIRSFNIVNPVEAVNLGLYCVAAGLIVAFASAYRTSALGQAEESREQLREREALLAALRESQARLDLATSAGGVGVWDWRLPTNELIYSEEAKAILGLPPLQPVTLEAVRALTHPDDAQYTWAQTERAIDPAIREEATYEYRIVTPAGDERWVLAKGRAVFQERDGQVIATRYLGTIQDVTTRKSAEQSRAAADARLRLAVEGGRMAVWQVDATTGLVRNPDLNRMLGYPPDANPSYEEINARYMPGELERVRDIARASLARGERYFEAEYRFQRPDGEVRWLLIRAELTLGPSGDPKSAMGVLLDITERKQSEERLKLLAREVDHRANNLMAVVQGTVRLSNADDVASLKQVIVGRVAALARAHQLLSEARWEGADLRRLVEEELLAFSLGEATRVAIAGEDIALPPAAAQAIAMALHELATNAAKYGALSAPTGRVQVAWERSAEGRLSIRWNETGGPLVDKPTRRGLGTTMLQRALEGPLKGVTRMDWRPEGLVCELELPLGEPATVEA